MVWSEIDLLWLRNMACSFFPCVDSSDGLWGKHRAILVKKKRTWLHRGAANTLTYMIHLTWITLYVYNHWYWSDRWTEIVETFFGINTVALNINPNPICQIVWIGQSSRQTHDSCHHRSDILVWFLLLFCIDILRNKSCSWYDGFKHSPPFFPQQVNLIDYKQANLANKLFPIGCWRRVEVFRDSTPTSRNKVPLFWLKQGRKFRLRLHLRQSVGIIQYSLYILKYQICWARRSHVMCHLIVLALSSWEEEHQAFCSIPWGVHVPMI